MTTAKKTPAKAFPASRVPSWDITTDVIVVGFGASGACAALEAGRAGSRVILFEVGAGSGGASALSGGEIYLGGSGGTPIQNKHGYQDSTEALFQYLMMAGGPDADEAKVRLYAENSLAHFHWLVENGVPYKGTHIPTKIIEPSTDDTLIWCGSEEAWPFSEKSKPAPRGHVIQYVGMGGGRLLMDILEKRVREVPNIDVQCSVRVLCLVQDEEGAVQGVVARIDGVEKFVKASKGVVLCAGGFCMNRDMVRRYAPDILITEDAIGATDDGSGALMGMSVGGDAIHMDQYFTTCPWYPPESLVKGIFVNIRGQRFINEDCYHGRVSHYMSRQPDGRVFLLVDNETFGRPEDYAKIDLAATGETWDEVEGELGLARGSLVTSVNFYNEYAAKGEDPLHHKAAKWLKPLTDAPFAAFELKFGQSYFSYFTLGGLNAKPTGEVLDRQGQPVPGLYAAGRTTSGLPRWGEGYSSGMSLADCTFFGRQAGKTVAAAPSRK